MRFDPADLPAEVLEFMTERHLATLSIVHGDGELHVTPIGFTWDDDAKLARVITFAGAKKVRLLEAEGSATAAVAQVDGGRWLSLHGTATVTSDPATNADAEARYAARYRPPGDRGADRRTNEIAVTRILGRA